MNNTVTTSNTKEFSNINTNEPITVDKAISLEDEDQSIHFTVTTPAKENDMNFKNCENNDLRKHICKLEAQQSAIKSYVNCEVSILTNKIESTSNDFEKRMNTFQGKEKSKIEILQQNMTFLQNELLSKNEIIKSLMEIQSSVLYTMPKNSSTFDNYSPTQRQSFHHSQPQSEQRDIHSRFQQSQNQLHKPQNNETQIHDELCQNNRTQQHELQQNQLSKLFIGNLNVNVTIDDIYELFGLKATKYLRSNTYVEMPLNRNGQTRGFAFVTAPDHMRNELLQLNNIRFRENNLVIEAARSELKTAKTIVKSNHSTRPQVVVNSFPENQDVFNRSKLVPGELSYTSAVKSTRLNSGNQNCIIIFGDNIFRGIRVREFNNEIKNGYAKFKTFPGSDSREIMHYVNPIIESGNYDSAVLHFGVNDLLHKALSKSDTVGNLIENVRKAADKCMSHGVSKVFVSAIVRHKRIPESLLEEVNEKISFVCMNNNFIFVDNSNISSIHLFDGGLH